MITVRLMGGLGNQLFQYAFGRQASQTLAVPLQLDLRWFESFAPGTTPRVYELTRYPIRAQVAAPGSLPWVPTSRPGILFWRVRRSLPFGPRVYERHQPGFSADAAVPRDNTLYIGYWQSERYFGGVATEIRAELTPSTPPTGQNAEYTSRIGESQAISLHVRRGDYVSSKQTNAAHGLTTLDYYRSAIRTVRERVSGGRFFVFSDDLDWCRENLALEPDTVFVEGNGGANAFEDLRLMSLCRHHIVANSSFSWWGAWLNPSPDKLVIAPRQWFADPKMNATDLVPATWIRL